MSRDVLTPVNFAGKLASFDSKVASRASNVDGKYEKAIFKDEIKVTNLI